MVMTRHLELRRPPDHIQVGVTVRTPRGEGVCEGTDVVVQTVVGVIYQHVATSNVPILSVQWAVSGYPAATVVDYSPTVAAGALTPLAGASLLVNPVTFGWWQPGTYQVTAYIETPYGSGSASHTFEVTAPLVRDFNGTTGIVGVGQYDDQPFLRLARSMQNFGSAGLQVQAIVAGTQTVGGTLAGIQLASNQRFVTDTDGTSWRMTTNGSYILDVGMTNTVWYQNHVVAIDPDGKNVVWDVTDGPGIGLKSQLIRAAFIGDGRPVVPEQYALYLMFIANVQGAIWVPLSLVQWSWSGFTQFEEGAWSPAQDPAASLSNPLQPMYPTWELNTTQSRWVQY